jgi:REP-associated tyrosine transposase
MARQPRIEYPGALYHVISRGIERRGLFRDDADRKRYLSYLERAVERFRCRILAYCLMSNHVHLAVETGKIPLSRIMRSINTSCAGYFNARHRRTGYLFQGRYKAFLVDQDEYLVSLVRYIHENPVRAGIVKRPGEYRWSSHRSHLDGGPRWLATDEVLGRFGRSRSTARKNFAAFFGEEEKLPYSSARRYVQTVVGEEGFAQSVLERPEDDALLIRRIEPERLVEWVSRAENVDAGELSGLGRGRDISRVRAICGYLGREVARLPLSRIARVLNRDTSTLWRDVARLEAEMANDKRLTGKLTSRGRALARFQNNT